MKTLLSAVVAGLVLVGMPASAVPAKPSLPEPGPHPCICLPPPDES